MYKTDFRIADGDHQIMETIQAKEAEPIYECCWYPLMNIQDPASCCFLTSSRDHPVHLWDSNTGEVSLDPDQLQLRHEANGLTITFTASGIVLGDRS